MRFEHTCFRLVYTKQQVMSSNNIICYRKQTFVCPGGSSGQRAARSRRWACAAPGRRSAPSLCLTEAGRVVEIPAYSSGLRGQGGSFASKTFPHTMPGVSAVPRERRRSKCGACKPSMMKMPVARPNTETARQAFATPRKSRCKMMSGRATNAMKALSCSGSRTVSTLATTRWRPRVRVFSKI